MLDALRKTTEEQYIRGTRCDFLEHSKVFAQSLPVYYEKEPEARDAQKYCREQQLCVVLGKIHELVVATLNSCTQESISPLSTEPHEQGLSSALPLL